MSANDLHGIHYSQQSKNVGGHIYNVGEDALPFICDDFMLVADGLGGDGFFAHARMNPLMWNKNERQKLFDVPVNDTDLETYFGRLFEEMDRDSIDGQKPVRYTGNVNYELHSGYYGSRLAAYAFVSLLKQDERFMPCNLFSELDTAQDDTQYQTILGAYSSALCDALMDRIRLFAERGNFVMESGRSQAKLLPTTLAAALYRDIGEETQVICLWAGDSRIVAQLGDGCVQLTADDEKNEAMTNLISLSVKPRLNVREFRFKRPFALFAVTDGTFDDMGGSLCFEAFVILNAMTGDSRDAMQQAWKDLFKIKSTDDSASIAYRFFGMDSMEASRAFASARESEIEEKYLSVLPELLNTDYKIALQHLKRETNGALRPFLPQIYEDPYVAEMYAEEEEHLPSPAYTHTILQLDIERNSLDQQETVFLERIKEYYKLYWLQYRPVSGERRLNDLAKQLMADVEEREHIREQYRQRLTIIKRETVKAVEDLTGQIDRGISVADKGFLSCSPEGMEENRIREIAAFLNRVGTDLEDFFKGKWDETKDFSKVVKCINRNWVDLLNSEAEVIEAYVRQTVFESDESYISGLPDEVQQSIQQIRLLEKQKQQLEEKKKVTLAEAAKKRADSARGKILDNLLEGNGLLQRLSEDLRSRLDAILSDHNSKAEALRDSIEKQTMIFTECDDHYLRFIGED